MRFTVGSLKVLKVLPIPLLKEKEAIFRLRLHYITLKSRMAPEKTRLREIHQGVWMLSCSFQMDVKSNYAIATCFFINQHCMVSVSKNMPSLLRNYSTDSLTKHVSHQEESVRAKEHLRFTIDVCNNGWSSKSLKKKNSKFNINMQ